ncbi:MAG: hypothetical protein ACRDY1_15475 [Acidimicrobiales bacterium]
MTITCPRCGLEFETQAVTNTRCRRCHTVVRIGSSPARRTTKVADETTFDANTDNPTADEVAAGLLVMASVVVGVLALVVPWIVGATRRHRADRAPTLADIGPAAEDRPTGDGDGHQGATAAHTGPDPEAVAGETG